jgi:hypothetical protein
LLEREIRSKLQLELHGIHTGTMNTGSYEHVKWIERQIRLKHKLELYRNAHRRKKYKIVWKLKVR